jgi:hypothetical protein
MSIMGNESGGSAEVAAALDEVERQLRSMPRLEIRGQEDLEWSIGSVFVDARVRSTEPPIVELEASRGVFRRASERRSVTLSAD